MNLLKRPGIFWFALASLMSSTVALAGNCGVAAPAPAPQPEGPGLQVNDTCAFPPPVLEKPTVTFPSANGFDNEAMRFPDMQAWISFAEAIQPIPGIGGYTFIGWPTQHQAYSKPVVPPATISLLESTKNLTARFSPRPPLQQMLRKQQAKQPMAGNAMTEATGPDCSMNNQEHVNLNPTLVTFLRKENLWNRAGVNAYTSAGKKIVMPQGAIEIKTNWVNVGSASAPGYITMQDGNGNTWKMIALHLNSKQLPNWTWATFEHKDNTCYSKYLNARDSFGFPDGATTPSAALQTVFSHYGVDASVANNYRLAGAQTDFTDDTGRPIILGNSVTEAGFQTTSSCVTCHGRASVNAKGSPELSVFNSQNQSFNGPLDPTWFFGANGVQNNFTTDFMWSMAFCMAADASSESQCPP